MTQSSQEWTKEILWKTVLSDMVCLSRSYPFKVFKAEHIPLNFLKAAFHKIYLVHFEYFVSYEGLLKKFSIYWSVYNTYIQLTALSIHSNHHIITVIV